MRKLTFFLPLLFCVNALADSAPITNVFKLFSTGGTGAVVSNGATLSAVPAGTSGNVMTSNGTTWVSGAASSAGANTSLSNLGTTAINQDLVPDSPTTRNLGSAVNPWAFLYLTTIIGPDGQAVIQAPPGFRTLTDELGNHALHFMSADRNLLAPDGSTSMLSWGTVGHLSVTGNAVENAADPVHAQDLATKNYVDTHSSPGGVTYVNSGAGLSGGPITTTGTLSCRTASGSQLGCLSSTDWNTFNNKQPAGAYLTSVSATSPLFSSGSNISCGTAGSSLAGCLSSADWNTFNGKQAAGAYITALTGDVAASGPGSAAATIQPLAVTLSKLASLQVNKNLFVDGSRTDSCVTSAPPCYTPDGSEFRPFHTIGAAITQIITNADNSTHQYTINVVPFGYAETLTFNNSLLYNIIIQSTTTSAPIATQSTSVNGITSTSNNTQLATLIFSNITVNGNVNFTGDVNGTNLCSVQCVFIASQFNNSSGTVTMNNVNNVSWYGGQIQGSGSVATFTNCAFCYMALPEGFIGGTTLHLVDNPGGNVPSQYFGNYLLFSHTKFYGTMTIDAGSELDNLFAYFGTTSNVTVNGTVHDWNTGWAGSTAAVFNSGSVYRNRGDTVWVPHTFNAGSTIQNQSYTYMLGGVFGASAVPATNAAIVTKDGHYKSTQTTAPTTTLSGNAGTGGSPSCTLANATDMAGTITLVTGTSAWASGTQCTVNFNKSHGVAPICLIGEANAQASASKVTQQINAPDAATGSFTVNFGVADSAQHTFKWKYHCLETQ